ncbi:hypothetical protein CR513_60720, partial [Mucuna pruriens]
VKFLEQFLHVIKHKQGKANVVENALSRTHSLLAMLETKLLDFEHMKELLYLKMSISKRPMNFVLLQPMEVSIGMTSSLRKKISSIKELLVKEAHKGGLMSHFMEHKTFKILQEHLFWPHIKRMYIIYAIGSAKDKVNTIHSYTYYALGWPISYLAIRYIMLVLWSIFSFKGVVRLPGLPKTIVSDKDSNFLNHFWKALWSKLGTKLLFSTTFHPPTNGQIEVINRTLSKLLRCFIGKSLKFWEEWIPHINFSYNRVVNTTTSHSLFVLVYGFNPLSPWICYLCLMCVLCLIVIGFLMLNLLKIYMLKHILALGKRLKNMLIKLIRERNKGFLKKLIIYFGLLKG